MAKSFERKDRVVYNEFGLQPASDVTEPLDIPPSQQMLKIEASRKGRKGKTVTVIRGFRLSTETLQALSKQLKNQCGTGGTVKDDTIEIQGDHRPKVQSFFNDLGYKTKLSGG